MTEGVSFFVPLINTLANVITVLTAIITVIIAFAIYRKMNFAVVAIQETREVSKASHILLNSNMRIQLTLTAELSRERANDKPTAANLLAADRAEELLREHNKNQQYADRVVPQKGFGKMP